MNIFEVVAMNKKLHEEHITSALGWFLDPRQSHGCGPLFLNRLLKEVLGLDDYKKWKIPDGSNALSKGSTGGDIFNVELAIEVGFSVGGNCVVDIIIIIEKDNKKLVLAIENKVSSKSVTSGQLFMQVNAILSDEELFDKNKDKLAYVYLTPEGSSAEREFGGFSESLDKDNKSKLIASKHLKWRGFSEKIFVSSLKDDNDGKIIPMVYETKFILKSFIQFISNGFVLPKPRNHSMVEVDKKCKGLDELYQYWEYSDSPASFYVGFEKSKLSQLNKEKLPYLESRIFKVLHNIEGINVIEKNWHEVKDFFEKMKKLNWKEPLLK